MSSKLFGKNFALKLKLRQGIDIEKDAMLHNVTLTMGLLYGIRQVLRNLIDGLGRHKRAGLPS